MKRTQLINQLATHLAATDPGHPLRVAIDGVDAAGKTSLADELSQALKAQPRPVIRASVDNFLNIKRAAADRVIIPLKASTRIHIITLH